MVKIFFNNAYRGARYIQDRKSAMQVGSFPWALSTYAGEKITEKIQSLLTRIIMAFHPIAYLFLWDEIIKLPTNEWISWVTWVSVAIVLFFCIWIFILSQKFQKPILFDNSTEKERESELLQVKKAIEEQTEKFTEQTAYIKELVDLLKGQEDKSDGKMKKKGRSKKA